MILPPFFQFFHEFYPQSYLSLIGYVIILFHDEVLPTIQRRQFNPSLFGNLGFSEISPITLSIFTERRTEEYPDRILLELF